MVITTILYSRAPTRISFAGGGTDVPEIASRIGGCVTSVAISRYVYASLKPRRDKKITIRSIKMDGSEELLTINSSIEYDGRLDLVKSVVEALSRDGFDITIMSEVPEHSGLGSSASAYVALIALFNDYYKLGMAKKDIAEMSFRLETDKLKNRVGKQDQYAACYGGLNFMEFARDISVKITPVKTAPSTLLELEKNIALLHVAERAKSAGEVIRDQTKKFSSNKEPFLKTKQLGEKARMSLEHNDLKEFGSVMALVWRYKKKFSAGATNPLIESIYGAAIKNGAYGGKISGAGGGGCGFWFCRDGTKNRVVAELSKLGAKPLDFKFDFEGVKTWSI